MIFAALTAVAAFGIGCMVQANSISAMVHETFAISPWWTGGVMTVLTAVVILGGIQSIATVCEKLVPFMAVFYVLGCAIILVMNAHDPSEARWRSSWAAPAAGRRRWAASLGAGVREAIRFGVARGLFSNESGLGSAPIVAAAARRRTRSVRPWSPPRARSGTRWSSAR